MFWVKNGKLVTKNGVLADCATCPCTLPCPCNDWYIQDEHGNPVVYNVSISLAIETINKWYDDYGYEQQKYQSHDTLNVTAQLSNIPASTLLGNGFCFTASSVSASNWYRYDLWNEDQGYVHYEIIQDSLDSEMCGGCPTDDPENEYVDDNGHGYQFTCNNNCENFRIRLSGTAASCHATHTQQAWWWGGSPGSDSWDIVTSITIYTPHLTFPAVNPNLRYSYVQDKGYVLNGDSLHLEYENGNAEDDNYTYQSYSHSITFTPILPSNN